MIKIICNYFIIFLFFFIVNCEEKKNEDFFNLEIKTTTIPKNEKVKYVFV